RPTIQTRSPASFIRARKSLIFGMVRELPTILLLIGIALAPPIPLLSQGRLELPQSPQPNKQEEANKNMALDKLPDWSQTIDSSEEPNWGGLQTSAVEFSRLSPKQQEEEVAKYSSMFCFPKMNLRKASGLYLFFRVLFDFPPGGMDRSKAMSFGGWLHPSI